MSKKLKSNKHRKVNAAYMNSAEYQNEIHNLLYDVMQEMLQENKNTATIIECYATEKDDLASCVLAFKYNAIFEPFDLQLLTDDMNCISLALKKIAISMNKVPLIDTIIMLSNDRFILGSTSFLNNEKHNQEFYYTYENDTLTITDIKTIE